MSHKIIDHSKKRRRRDWIVFVCSVYKQDKKNFILFFILFFLSGRDTENPGYIAVANQEFDQIPDIHIFPPSPPYLPSSCLSFVKKIAWYESKGRRRLRWLNSMPFQLHSDLRVLVDFLVSVWQEEEEGEEKGRENLYWSHACCFFHVWFVLPPNSQTQSVIQPDFMSEVHCELQKFYFSSWIQEGYFFKTVSIIDSNILDSYQEKQSEFT